MISANDFWKWFEKNNSKFFFLNQIDDAKEKEKLLNEFEDQLHNYCDKLFFEIGGHPDETQDLIITAAGKISLFPKVEELVSQAPTLKDWNIIAFKPATDPNFVIEYEDVKIDPATSWFMPLTSKKNPGQLGIRLHLQNYDDARKETFLNAAYLALDAILGEKAHALNIQHVAVTALQENPEEIGLIELTQLPQYVEWKKKEQ